MRTSCERDETVAARPDSAKPANHAAPAYPAGSGKVGGKPKLDGLGLQLDLIQRLHTLRARRVSLPVELAASLSGFVVAAAADKGLSPADYLQARVALGDLCAFHLVEFGGDYVSGRFCTTCEFGHATTRYRGQAEIPFPMGEVIDPRDLMDESSDRWDSDRPGFPQ